MHLNNNFDANIFTALQYYLNGELLALCDPYMDVDSLSAIRLMCLKTLALTRQKVLNIFNKLFVTLSEDLKSQIRKMDEIEARGLFHKILLPSLHLWSEKIQIQLPNDLHKNEAESIIDWLYYNSKVNTKEDEKFHFICRTKNIRLALIVLANDEYFDERGFWPYIRRAHTYTSKEYDTLFIISLGKTQGYRAKELSNVLTNNNCFSMLSKQSQVYIEDTFTGNRILLTCIALKPDLDNVISAAWQKISDSKNNNQKIHAFISEIHGNGLIVNFEGLLLDVDSAHVSSLSGINHHKYFQEYDVLELNIEHYDDLNKRVVLSNKDTETDPIHVINTFKSSINDVITANVVNIISYDGVEKGVVVSFSEYEIEGYISRHNITRATYTKISDIIKVDTQIQTKIINYDIERKRFICRLENVFDPLNNDCPKINDDVDLQVMSPCERGVSCKLMNGLEGFIPVSLFSWFDKSKNRDLLLGLKQGDLLKARLIEVDTENQKLVFDRRALLENNIKEFSISSIGKELTGVIENISLNSIDVRLENGIRVYVPMKSHQLVKLKSNPSLIGTNINISVSRYDDLYENCVGSVTNTL
ncbi:MAG: 30S ribosomal protein S1 [Candidatus Cloacimonetes bacterium]|nr:30S ribosomal protein S1 [Candidatus Cloacimonadota bacterium]